MYFKVKSQLLPYFLSNTDYPPIALFPRRALVIVLHPVTSVTVEAVVNLESKSVESWDQLGQGVDSTFAFDELDFVGRLVLEDPLVLARLRLYGEFYGNTSNVITDVW